MPRIILSILVLSLGAVASASAQPRAYRFETGLQLVVPDTDAPPSHAVGVALGLVMDDTFILDFRLRAMSPEPASAPSILDAQIGVRYQIDVTRWIPSIRIGVGGQVYLAAEESVARPHSAAFAEVGFGLLYALGSRWMVGADFSHMAGLARSVGGQRRSVVGLRLVYQPDP